MHPVRFFVLTTALLSVPSRAPSQAFVGADLSAQCAAAPQSGYCETIKKLYVPPSGVLPNLIGVWTNGKFVWNVERIDAASVRTNFFETNGKPAGSYLIKPIKGGFTSAAPISNFGMYFYTSKDLLVFLTPNRFQLTNAKLVSGQLSMEPDDAAWNGIYNRLSAEELAHWQQKLRERADSAGNIGGVFRGAIAGASGMASGGSVDAALAGAVAGGIAGGAGVDASTIQRGFQQGAQETNSRNAEMQARFEESMAREAPGYGDAGRGQVPSHASERGSNQSSSTVRAASAAKVQRTFRFHLQVSLENRPQDTANAICLSNAIVETFEGNENGWGDDAIRDSIYERYRPSFEAKCSRLRPLVGTTSYSYDQGWNSGSIGVAPNPMYFRVTLP